MLRLTGGQFEIPFSAESLISDDLNIPIARARAVNSLVPGRDTAVPASDVGFEVGGAWGRLGNEVLVEYVARAFCGQMLVDPPNSHYQAAAGRIVLHRSPGLTLGGNWYGSFSAPIHAEKRRREVEGGYERGPLCLRAEQIGARDGRLERRGGCALASWRLSPCWERWRARTG